MSQGQQLSVILVISLNLTVVVRILKGPKWPRPFHNLLPETVEGTNEYNGLLVYDYVMSYDTADF